MGNQMVVQKHSAQSARPHGGLVSTSRRPRTVAEKRHITWAERAWSAEEMSDLIDGVQMHDPNLPGAFEKICNDRNLKFLFQQRRTPEEARQRWQLLEQHSAEIGVQLSLASHNNTLAFVPLGRHDRHVGRALKQIIKMSI